MGVSPFGHAGESVGRKTRRAKGSAALSRIRAGFEPNVGRGLSFRLTKGAFTLVPHRRPKQIPPRGSKPAPTASSRKRCP
jgi:hypothetical protein